MTGFASFPPTLAAAHARIAAVRPADYARTRNALDGAVTGLSPYITHGFVTLPEALAGVLSRHALPVQHKFVYELGWREYFRHVWRHRGDGIFDSLHTGVLPDDAYARELPADLREARTGIAAIDSAVGQLYATGYLHNHARMWLASYAVHLRKVHWRTGADWMYRHLLDGDLASNHLSWQWVAATGSHKPYLFNAENVARFAPLQWHSPGSAIDASYEALDAIARARRAFSGQPNRSGIDEPAIHPAPPAALRVSAPDPAAAAGRDVWLVHPWALHEPPDDLPADALRIGIYSQEFHSAWPWSAARWAFVRTRMAELAPVCWSGDLAGLALGLSQARSVRTPGDPHIEPYLHAIAECTPGNPLFAKTERPCASFSQWWTTVMRGVERLEDLPGLSGLAGL